MVKRVQCIAQDVGGADKKISRNKEQENPDFSQTQD